VPKCRFFLISLALLGASEAIATNDTLVCANMATKLEADILLSDDNLVVVYPACDVRRNAQATASP
jgi:hypothetical protein